MVDQAGDKLLSDDELLSAGERWVRHRFEKALGPTSVIDRSQAGGPEGQHDLEAVLPDGRIAAIEITSEADPARLSVIAAARHHLSKVKVPGSQFWWLVQLTPQADARALSKPAGLAALLAGMEEQGESSVTTLSDYRNPWRWRLKELGIQSVHGIAGSDRRGTVSVMPDIVAGWGWVQLTADKWITDFLATKLGKDHLDKLARADAAERHLVVLLYPDTDAGLGSAVSDDLPSVEPPPPLTHLWLVLPTDPAKAFCWTRSSAWAVVDL
jgi:hypothetical protein